MEKRTTELAAPHRPAAMEFIAGPDLEGAVVAVHNSTLMISPLDLPAAYEHVAAVALRPAAVGPVGLELEYHVVDLHRPQRRVNHPELTALIAALPPLPEASAVTMEPGGQLELSSPPGAGVPRAIAGLQADEAVVTEALRAAGFGLAPLGSDPARGPRRITPVARYAAMERHFDAIGCGGAGRQMMTATAALQVNVDAGPAPSWAERLHHIHSLGPTLSAISACSPYVAGHASGWRSMRQQAWLGIDPARTDPIPDRTDPCAAWAEYALAAPVMLIRSLDGAPPESVANRVPFADWVSGAAMFYRRPTVDDLNYHLSTLFPPVRLRGYLELRFLDAVPRARWAALAAIVVTLIDDPVAADEAAEAVGGVEGAWIAAARDGLDDVVMRRAGQRCLDIAARRCPPELRSAVESYAELVERGRTPGDDLRDAVTACGPLAALVEATHA